MLLSGRLEVAGPNTHPLARPEFDGGRGDGPPPGQPLASVAAQRVRGA
jgi:hypothetical protein